MRKHYTASFKAKVVQELLKEDKTVAQIAAEYEVHPTQLNKWKSTALQGLPSLFEEKDSLAALKASHEEQLNTLYAEIGRLTTQLSWLEKNLASCVSREERRALVDWQQRDLPVSTQAELLSLNRSGLYYQPVPPSAEEVALKHRIDELYTQWPFYGSRRITAQLQQEGVNVNRKAVQRHMREMGIEGVSPGPNLSKRTQKEGVYPYLLRHITSAYPNHIWGIDITYIRLRTSWMYLVAILDWYSRSIVSWELDHTLEMPFVLTAMQRALAQATPHICNSDQGSHFTSPQYAQLLLDANVQISMDGKGRALDNVFTERLWRSIKYEEVYIHDYASPKEARQQLRDYVQFYNHQRLHQALDYQTPASVYFRQMDQEAVAQQ
jgi:putative transposase